MVTKKITIIFRSIFVLFFSVISQSLAEPLPTRPVCHDQNSYRKIDPTFKSRQALDYQAQERPVPKSDREFSDTDSSDENPSDVDAALYHRDVTDMMQRIVASSVVARKALLEKLIQAKRKVLCVAQGVHPLKKQLSSGAIVIKSEPVLALAAGAIIAEEVFVAAATVATGLYVGSGNQETRTSSVNAAPAKKAETPRPNPTTPTTTAKVKVQKPAGVKKQEQSPQKPEVKATPQQKVQQPIKNDLEFSSSNTARQDAVKTFLTQKAHDAEQKDRVVENTIFVIASGLQQHQQAQKQARTAQKIAGWSQEKEADIQRRMRAEGKSRWQIEEEDRLFVQKVEQLRAKEATQQKERQEEEARQREEKKNNNLKKSAKAKKQSGVNRVSNSGPGQDPDDDDKKSKEKHPHGIAEDNPKHHQNSSGNISKPPRDAQKALDESIEVPGKDFRVAIQDGKIVQLNKHSPGRYHAYLVESFHKLDPKAQRALSKAGFVNAKSGKII